MAVTACHDRVHVTDLDVQVTDFDVQVTDDVSNGPETFRCLCGLTRRCQVTTEHPG